MILKSLWYRYHYILDKLRGSLVVKSIKRALVGEASLLRTSIPASGSLVLLELELSNPAGVVLATRLRVQSLLEAILGLGVVETLGDVLAVRATRGLDVLVLNVAGGSATVGLGRARLSGVGVGVGASRERVVGAMDRRGLGGAASAGVLGSR